MVMTAVSVCVSEFLSVKPLDMFEETLGQFGYLSRYLGTTPAASVPTTVQSLNASVGFAEIYLAIIYPAGRVAQ